MNKQDKNNKVKVLAETEEEYYRRKKSERILNSNRRLITSKAISLASKISTETDPVRLSKFCAAMSLLAIAAGMGDSRYADRSIKAANRLTSGSGTSDSSGE